MKKVKKKNSPGLKKQPWTLRVDPVALARARKAHKGKLAKLMHEHLVKLGLVLLVVVALSCTRETSRECKECSTVVTTTINGAKLREESRSELCGIAPYDTTYQYYSPSHRNTLVVRRVTSCKYY